MRDLHLDRLVALRDVVLRLGDHAVAARAAEAAAAVGRDLRCGSGPTAGAAAAPPRLPTTSHSAMSIADFAIMATPPRPPVMRRAPEVAPDRLDLGRVAADDARDDALRRCRRRWCACPAGSRIQVAHARDAAGGLDLQHQESRAAPSAWPASHGIVRPRACAAAWCAPSRMVMSVMVDHNLRLATRIAQRSRQRPAPSSYGFISPAACSACLMTAPTSIGSVRGAVACSCAGMRGRFGRAEIARHDRGEVAIPHRFGAFVAGQAEELRDVIGRRNPDLEQERRRPRRNLSSAAPVASGVPCAMLVMV